MKITYDSKARAVYIYLTDKESYVGIVDHSQEITDNVVVDWMKDGTLYGIDILDVDKLEVELEKEANSG